MTAFNRDALAAPQRLSITLDPGVVLERLILQRAAGLHRRRAKDWLRSLLVQGFLVEGQWLQVIDPTPCVGVKRDAPPVVPATPFTQWWGQGLAKWPHAAAAPECIPMPAADSRPLEQNRQATSGTKPFAHLRSVIGQVSVSDAPTSGVPISDGA